MGAFYGSIHIRTGDPALVKASVQRLHEQTKVRFLLAPCIRGWVTVFPNECHADFSVSETIAKDASATVLHCVVHDDDVFMYRLYESNRFLDEYSSNPGCFDETAEPGPTGGRVELIEKLLREPATTETLRRLLAAPRTEFIFEQRRLSQFAKLIGLPNACTSYEYLQGGERDGITRWREFVHIPDLSDEKAAKRAAAARVRSELKRLLRENVLLRELKHSFRCVDPVTSDLLLTVPGEMFGERKPLRLLALPKPWTGEPHDTGLDLPGTTHVMTVSASGRWLAVGHAFGRWAVELWDRQASTRVLELEHKRAVSSVAFSPDEQFLVSRSENEVLITSVPERRQVRMFDAGNFGNAAAIQSQTGMVIADARENWRTTYLDRPDLIEDLRRTPEDINAMGSRLNFLGMQLMCWLYDEEIAHQCDPEKVKAARQEWDVLTVEMNEICGTVSALGFTANGRFLICATSQGLLVFYAMEIAAAHKRLPRARFSFGLQREIPRDFNPAPGSPYIYSFAEDTEQSRIIFGGLDGVIYFMNLADGTSGELFRPPEANRLWRIALTPERSALVCTVLPSLAKQGGEAKVQIWNYEALCRARGLAH
jgi:hypothetical protein